MKKWKCTVCGYIHHGEEPPEKCPVCNAPKEKFVEIEDESNNVEMPVRGETDKPVSRIDALFILMSKHHVHPMSVHIPNGVGPVSVIFVVLAVVFNFTDLTQAAFYNLFFIVLTMPLVLFSGYVEWQKKYNGAVTKYFLTKILCGAVVLSAAIVLVIWYIIDPEVTGAISAKRWGFVFVNFIMLAGIGVAGFIGGKLVFKD